MQGLLYHYFQSFVEETAGAGSWHRIRERAAIRDRSFVPWRPYPDEYAPALISALLAEPKLRPHGRRGLLFRYGRHVGACFRRDFTHYFDRFASAREMLLGIEPVIHGELRRREPSSAPPRLKVMPLPGGRLRLVYTSQRRLCDVARGLVDYIGEVFGDRAIVHESACMESGANACDMVIAFSSSPRQALFEARRSRHESERPGAQGGLAPPDQPS